MSAVHLRNTRTYVIEVGWRAAARTESQPRDLRWWYGLLGVR